MAVIWGQGPVKVTFGVIAMKRHHALLPETAGVMASQGMMALQRSEAVARACPFVPFVPQGRLSGQALSLAKETKQSNLTVAP